MLFVRNAGPVPLFFASISKNLKNSNLGILSQGVRLNTIDLLV